MTEKINHPPHYKKHPSGIECIQITEHMNFCLGNAVKYIWRADHKDDALEDLQKAAWYINREIARRTGGFITVKSLRPEQITELEKSLTESRR